VMGEDGFAHQQHRVIGPDSHCHIYFALQLKNSNPAKCKAQQAAVI
jgi:hypothetical protein